MDDIRVQILEKIYHSCGNPLLSTPLRRKRELFWIKELGTAKPYGFNDRIKGVGTLDSTSCKKTNVYTIFNKNQRRKRSHGKRRYNKKAPQPESNIDTLITLVDMIDQPEGVHKIKTHLFSVSLPQLSSFQEISYQYTNAVASELSNFSSTLSNLDITNYLSNPQHCQCNTSKFCYEPHGHVITGDLMLMENVKLRELVAKEQKYREPNKINWKLTKTMILDSIDPYSEKWSKREQVDLKYLSEWKDQIKELVVERISDLTEKI